MNERQRLSLQSLALLATKATDKIESFELVVRAFELGQKDGIHCASINLILKENLGEVDRAVTLYVYRTTGYDREQTAKRLGIAKTTLFRKLKEYGILDHTVKQQALSFQCDECGEIEMVPVEEVVEK